MKTELVIRHPGGIVTTTTWVADNVLGVITVYNPPAVLRRLAYELAEVTVNGVAMTVQRRGDGVELV